MSDSLIESFDPVATGYSSDRVVADLDFNSRFIEACRKRGLGAPVSHLNR